MTTLGSIQHRLDAKTPNGTANREDVKKFVEKQGTDKAGKLDPRFTPERVENMTQALMDTYDTDRNKQVDAKDTKAFAKQLADPNALTDGEGLIDAYKKNFELMDSMQQRDGRATVSEAQELFNTYLQDKDEAYVSAKVAVGLLDENGDEAINQGEVDSLAADLRAQMDAAKAGNQ